MTTYQLLWRSICIDFIIQAIIVNSDQAPGHIAIVSQYLPTLLRGGCSVLEGACPRLQIEKLNAHAWVLHTYNIVSALYDINRTLFGSLDHT